MSGRPTVISLFAGCGGSSLGYKWAGFRELLAIEWDRNAIETFRLNFPDTPIWGRDIRKVQGKEILEFCSLGKGGLDLLDGSPPCQGYSTAGKRKVTDERNDLFRHNIRLIDEIQPKVFVIENVSGLIKGTMKGLFKEYMQLLKELPYQVKCKLMNAKWYKVPQSRQRLIWIGVRNDLGIEPSYPARDKEVITTMKALENIINIEKNPTPELKGNVKLWVNELKEGEALSKIAKKKIGKENYFNVKKVYKNRPSQTINRLFMAGAAGLIHYSENRWLTIDELKRIHSYPDDYKFIGKFEEQWARIGNSVPPKFMQAIAETIKNKVFCN